MRKLKSIQKILEENPDAYFDSQGCIFFGSTRGLIDAEMFEFFGKKVLIPHEDGWIFKESWFEETPVKKLYAYALGNNEILFFAKEKCTYPNYTRAPEYDITYNEKQDEI